MGFLLLDRPNPHGNHFYSSRRERTLAIVVHITAGSEDLDALDDNSAENVANYAATTNVLVSWHSGSDADSWVDLLPSSAVAWHASDYNSPTYGHEISKRTTDWRNVPRVWTEKTLRMAALGPDRRGGLRQKALELGIPFRWATKAELDHARATGGAPVGFITHAELQWSDRRDPGYVTEGGRVIDTFPRTEFMQYLTLEDDGMSDVEAYNGVGLMLREAASSGPGGNGYDNYEAITKMVKVGAYNAVASVLKDMASGAANDLVEAIQTFDSPDQVVVIDEAALQSALAKATPELLATIAKVVNDETDRRARDGDPSTGPKS